MIGRARNKFSWSTIAVVCTSNVSSSLSSALLRSLSSIDVLQFCMRDGDGLLWVGGGFRILTPRELR